MPQHNQNIDILLMTASKGGVENVVNQVSQYMKSTGYNVRIIQVIHGAVEWVTSGAEVIYLFEENTVTLENAARRYISTIMNSYSPDAIIATGWPFMCYVARAVVDTMQLPATVISWLHNVMETYIEGGQGDYEFLKLADAHLAISQMIANQLLANGCQNVLRVYNPIDLSKYKINSNQHTPSSSKLSLLYVGRISEIKRPDLLLLTLAKVKDKFNLRIVGDCNSDVRIEDLYKLSELLEISDIIDWKSWAENPWSETNDIDYCIQLSDREGFSMVMLEALASGIPMITTPVSGATELIKDGVNGYIVPHDENGIVKVLENIAQNNHHPILPADCRNSVLPYDADNALSTFINQLQLCIKNA